MPSFSSQMVAVMTAVLSVIVGCLSGGGTSEAALDISSAVAILGFAIVLSKAIAGEILGLHNRFGAVVILGITLMF